MPTVFREIDNMTTSEKMSTMEYIWNALQSHYVSSAPDWHNEVLSQRRARIENGEATFLSIDEAESIIESECYAR